MAQAVPGDFHGFFTIRGEAIMQWDILFFFNSALLGVGLAMDAFSESLANDSTSPACPGGGCWALPGCLPPSRP